MSYMYSWYVLPPFHFDVFDIIGFLSNIMRSTRVSQNLISLYLKHHLRSEVRDGDLSPLKWL